MDLSIVRKKNRALHGRDMIEEISNMSYPPMSSRIDSHLDVFSRRNPLFCNSSNRFKAISDSCASSDDCCTDLEDSLPNEKTLEDVLEISFGNSVTSLDSIPQLDSTPIVFNHNTPNISLDGEIYEARTDNQESGISLHVLEEIVIDELVHETRNIDGTDEKILDICQVPINPSDMVSTHEENTSLNFMQAHPLPEGTPPVDNDISTPNASRKTNVNFMRNTPQNAGFTHSDSSNEIYDKNRPQTHIFSHGSVYTYDNLDIIATNTKKARTKAKGPEMSSSVEKDWGYETVRPNLDPLALSFIPKIDHGAFTNLKNIRTNNLKNVIIGQLNINSMRNKFHALSEIIRGNIDILVLTETKLDHTFPEKQFLIPGYKKPYRRDRNIHGGGVMIYVREDIPSDILIKHKTPTNIEAIFVEINLRKNKLLLVGTYHSTNKKHGQKDDEYFRQIGFALDVYSRFDKFLLAGDVNVPEDDINIAEFMTDFHAKNLVKEATCFKSINNPSCIDLFITNSYLSFQNTTTVATGLSDFHKMTVTVLKTTFPKAKPRVITYRTPYNPLDLENALKENLEGMTEKTYENFENKVTISYDSVSTEKQRILRANDKPWVTKEMRKEIMYRSQLQNKKFKFGRPEDIEAFKRQQNYCNRLYHRARKDYCDKLDIKSITDNTKFWDTMKPLFSDKGGVRDRIMLVENDEIISESKEVAETFNNFFQIAGSVDSLGITENKLLLKPVSEQDTGVEKYIKQYESHPSIISIRKHVQITVRFEYLPITPEEMEKHIAALDAKKNGGCIPTKLLKEMRHIVKTPLAEVWNEEVIKGKIFPDKLKLGDITPVFKKLQNTIKKNYRPITVLVVVSKLFETIMDKQSNDYMEQYLSKYLCGYRKNFNCEVAMVPMIEQWKKARDNGEHAGGVLMDLSKAFDTINHGLLIAKLHAYGFSMDALEIAHSYLSNIWHRTKVDGTFSSWKQILSGVPQGSVNGPKWFNIYLNDFFFLFLDTKTKVCNIADDSTPYACDVDMSTLLRNLESDVASAILWFDANYMMLNQPKCHFLIASHSPEHLWIQVGEQIIWESREEILLGVTIDKGLKFSKHVENICNKASAKVTALARLIKVVSKEKKRILMNAFIESQFSYCPLIWMFCHSRRLNKRINHIHERGLRIVYEDYTSSFTELLKINGSVSIHHRNIQLVAIVMFKVKNGLCPEIMRDIFQLNTNTDSTATFVIPRVKGEFMGKLSLRYFGPVVWEIMLPEEYKSVTNVEKFKKDIKDWVPDCKCRLCKTYISGLGFTEISK